MSEQIPPASSNDARQPPEYLVVGHVLRPHGVKGALLLQSDSELIFTISPGSNVFLGENLQPLTVKRLNPHRSQFLMFVNEIGSRDEADAFRGESLSILFEGTDPLPDGVYYHWQLIGINVITEEGESLGVLEQIIETGANDVYIVRGSAGKELLLPAIKSVIKGVDLEEQRMTVSLLPGLI
ncbi:MAG: 16S rRNA processing protein RimM [Anaerolineales bacterium]|nr:16S rRNA processing protein RimM [Anaerolineales bacterium]